MSASSQRFGLAGVACRERAGFARLAPGTLLLGALVLAAPAGAVDSGSDVRRAPSLDDLHRGSARAAGVVTACRTEPSGCADAETRAVLARAFYTLVLDDLVYGREVDAEQVANVRALDPHLFGRLPALLPSEPAPWVVALQRTPPPTAPALAPPSGPTPAVEAPADVAVDAPEPMDPWTEALAALDADDPAHASRLLLPLGRSHPESRLALSRAVERMGMPAAALALRVRWLRTVDAANHPRSREVSRDAVRLAVVAGSRRPLVELAEILHPSAWDPSVRSDGWLALGQSWQTQGDLSPALKAFSEIRSTEAPYARGEYQTGVIYHQTGQPWQAVDALQNAWEAPAQDIDDERVREMALWQLAELYAALQRPQEAYAVYEALAITSSPLSERARHRCARVAHGLGDAPLARSWLDQSAPRGVFRAEHLLLQARMAELEGNRTQAARLLEQAEPELRQLTRELAALTGDLGQLWSALHAPDRNPVLAARLDADPEIAGFRAHLDALAADRRVVARHPDPEWRRSVGKALDQMLLVEERKVRSQATAAAYTALVAVQREIGERTREATRLRQALDRSP